MQVFLPYPDFQQSIQCLDYKRLGKQRVECAQILNALNGKSRGWVNHPATRMFRGYSDALRVYHDMCIAEWVIRGYRNTMPLLALDLNAGKPFKMPPWVGSVDFHNSHKSNLLRKDPDFYGRYGWDVPDDLEYVWPC